VREFAAAPTALLAAALLAVSPVQVAYAQEARAYALLPVLVALATLGLTFMKHGGAYAAHLSGHGFNVWGIYMGFTLNKTLQGARSIYDGRAYTGITFCSGLGSPAGMTYDPSGNIYVADQNGNIWKVTPTGTVSNYQSGLDTGYKGGPTGVTLDAAKNLYQKALDQTTEPRTQHHDAHGRESNRQVSPRGVWTGCGCPESRP